MDYSTAATALSSSLEVMRYQEDSCYHIKDYVLDGAIDDAAAANSDTSLSPYLDIEELASCRSFRSTMVNWGCQILDLVKCQRETADYALSYFDRFLHTAHGSVALYDRPTFQLAFVSCLYSAVKLHEASSMPPKVFSKLSRWAYDEEEIQEMEIIILKSIGWRMNPPTALAFVRQLLGLISLADLSIALRLTVYDLAKAQIEVVLSDYRFVSVKKSVLAIAAVMNALEGLQYSPSFGMELMHRAGMQNEDQEELSNVRDALYQEVSSHPHDIAGYSGIGNSSGSPNQDIEMAIDGEEVINCDSPRSVVVQESCKKRRDSPA